LALLSAISLFFAAFCFLRVESGGAVQRQKKMYGMSSEK